MKLLGIVLCTLGVCVAIGGVYCYLLATSPTFYWWAFILAIFGPTIAGGTLFLGVLAWRHE